MATDNPAADPRTRGLDADAVARLQASQAEFLDALRTAVADRPAHAEYLKTLIEVGADNMAGPQFWPGVSRTVADALDDDVTWCTRNVRVGDGFPSPFPNSYRVLRDRNRVAAARRAATIEHDKQWDWTRISMPTTKEDR